MGLFRDPNMRIAAGVVAFTVAVVGLSACDPFGQQFNDLEGVEQIDPDYAVVYASPDGFPNLAVECIGDVAFVLTTREKDAVTRVPELDSKCGAQR